VTAQPEAPALDMLTVSHKALTINPGDVWEHLTKPGAVVRVVSAKTGEVAGWVYPPDHEPTGYRESGMDDVESLRELAAQQRSQILHAGWRTRRHAELSRQAQAVITDHPAWGDEDVAAELGLGRLDLPLVAEARRELGNGEDGQIHD
jgi:hypothetical protein